MPHIRKEQAPLVADEPEIQGRYAELGDSTVSFESFPLDVDPAPFFRGLPGDRCPCPHWGIVVSGRLVVRYADREETLTAGDVYYLAPGHLPLVTAGTEVIEFSPTDRLQETMAVVGANMAASAQQTAAEPVR